MFASHKQLPEGERQIREERSQFFKIAQKSLKKFNPQSSDFASECLKFFKMSASLSPMRALRLANIYLWAVVPLKVQFLRLDDLMPRKPPMHELYQQVWSYEHELLEDLRYAAKEFKKSRARSSPHSLCHSGWWKASALADCSDHLLQLLRSWDELPAVSGGDAVPDLVPPAVCTFAAMPDEVATQNLLFSHCVADVMQYHASCAYTHLFAKRDLDEAIAHLCVASLMALLCDGCRVDGFGFGSVPLDQLLWRFGLLVLNALQLKDLEWEKDPQRYAWAAATASSFPLPNAWRGNKSEAILFGRTRCQAVLRPPLCIYKNSLVTGDFVAEEELITERLPTCHYERQKASSTGLLLKPMLLEEAREAFTGTGPEGCSQAPAETMLLLLPVFPKMIGHLTTEMIWLMGALAWFYGPTGKKVLRALWQAAGEHEHMGPAPEGLHRNTTEVLFVPSPGHYADPEKLLLKDLFAVLSSRPIGSLLPNKQGCRCYRRGAVWGFMETPFSGPGDLNFLDSQNLRLALVRHVESRHVAAPLSKGWMAPREGPQGVRILLVDRCKDIDVPCKRRITNLNTLALALSQLEGVSLRRVRLEELPVLEQVQRIFQTEVLLAPFGATLAWIPLMKKNSFVIEMHPGRPEALTLWGSCWTSPPTVFPEAATAATWDVNPRALTETAHVKHACSAKPATINRRCLRSFRVESFEIWSFEVNVDEIMALALYSDSKIKENVEDADLQTLMQQIKHIRIREFDHGEDEFFNKFFSRRQLGIMAHELKPVMPTAVGVLPERRWTNPKGVTNQTKNVMLVRDTHLLFAALGAVQLLAKKADVWDEGIEQLFKDNTKIVEEQDDNRRKREELLEQLVRVVAKVENQLLGWKVL
eukprot:symbB.v1.2.024603.t1/scaffold2342.1/size81844/6